MVGWLQYRSVVETTVLAHGKCRVDCMILNELVWVLTSLYELVCMGLYEFT